MGRARRASVCGSSMANTKFCQCHSRTARFTVYSGHSFASSKTSAISMWVRQDCSTSYSSLKDLPGGRGGNLMSCSSRLPATPSGGSCQLVLLDSRAAAWICPLPCRACTITAAAWRLTDDLSLPACLFVPCRCFVLTGSHRSEA